MPGLKTLASVGMLAVAETRLKANCSQDGYFEQQSCVRENGYIYDAYVFGLIAGVAVDAFRGLRAAANNDPKTEQGQLTQNGGGQGVKEDMKQAMPTAPGKVDEESPRGISRSRSSIDERSQSGSPVDQGLNSHFCGTGLLVNDLAEQ